MKITNAIWFTEISSVKPIGIVMGETEHGERKAYIGTAFGNEEYADAVKITKNGARVSKEGLQEVIDFLGN